MGNIKEFSSLEDMLEENMALHGRHSLKRQPLKNIMMTLDGLRGNVNHKSKSI
jgi:hypothetical protein